MLAEGPLTLAKIVAGAGVGRSTFYEFFDDPQHVAQELELRTLRALEAALQSALGEARTPVERLRAISRRWFEQIEAHAIMARRALSPPSDSAPLSPAGELLRGAVLRFLEAARSEKTGWASVTDEEARVLATVGAAEVLTRHHLRARFQEAPRLLADAMLRLLR